MRTPNVSSRGQPPPAVETLAAAAGYLLLASALLAPLLLRFRTAILADDIAHPGDGSSFGAVWTFWWLQKRLGAWQNPWLCDWVLPPLGADLSFDTHAAFPTLMAMPLVRALGVVGAFNAMVVALLVLGALVLYGSLRRTFDVPWGLAFVAGACFGFGSTALSAAHRSPSVLGAFLGAGSVAMLLHAYRRDAFDLRHGAVLAAAAWACFWTSLGTFGALACTLAFGALVHELARSGRAGRWKRKAIFIAPLLAGTPSLWFLHRADSALPAVAAAAPTLPLAAILLAAIALAVFVHDREARRAGIALAALAGLAALLAADSGGVGSAALGFATGRLGARPLHLVPFALFGLLALGTTGAAALWRSPRAWARPVAVLALVGLVLESRPVMVHPSPVRRLEPIVPGRRIDPRWRVVVVPRDSLRAVDDTYQIAVDAPFVRNRFLESRLSRHAELERRFPSVYRDESRVWDAEWGRELAELDAGSLILTDRTRLAELPPVLQRNVWMPGPDGVLVGLR